MLGTLSSSVLDLYRGRIWAYYCTYTPRAWGIIYSAERVARLEHADRVRRALKEKAELKGQVWDDATAWERVFRQMAEKEHSFWGRHVEQPVTVLLARPDLKVNVLGEIIHSGAAGSAASGKRGAAAGTGPLALLDDVEERPKKAPKRRGRPARETVRSATTTGTSTVCSRRIAVARSCA